MQTSGTPNKEQRIPGAFIGITNLIFICCIGDTVEITKPYAQDSIHHKKQTGNDDDMYYKFLHLRIGNR